MDEPRELIMADFISAEAADEDIRGAVQALSVVAGPLIVLLQHQRDTIQELSERIADLESRTNREAGS